MKKIQKCVASSEGKEFYYVIDERDSSSMQLFCDVCGFVMRNSNDSTFYQKFGCCEECAMTFAESRKDAWCNGWRPDKDTLKEYKKQLRKKSLKFKD